MCAITNNERLTQLLSLNELNIIDLTGRDTVELFVKSLSKKHFLCLKKPADAIWELETYCEKLLENMAAADADLHDLRVTLRTHVINPTMYRMTCHYDLRAVEKIAGHW